MGFLDTLRQMGQRSSNPFVSAASNIASFNKPAVPPFPRKSSVGMITAPADPFAFKSSTPQMAGIQLPNTNNTQLNMSTPTGPVFGQPPQPRPNMSTNKGSVYAPPPVINQSFPKTPTTPTISEIYNEKEPQVEKAPSSGIFNPETGLYESIADRNARLGFGTAQAQPFISQPEAQQEPTLESLAANKAQTAQTGTPAIPDVSRETQTAFDAATNAYEQSLKLSPDELTTQAELDQIIESFQKGYQTIEDQTIPMGFITGQLQSLEKRARNMAEPLEAKLTRMQAQRTSSLEASKFSLLRAESQKNKEEAKAETLRKEEQGEIREFDGNLVRVMPDGTMEVISKGAVTAEQFTLSQGQVRFDAQGNVIATGNEDPKTAFELQKLQLDIEKAQQELSQSGQQLTPQQIQDAVSKGYTSEPDLKLYASMSFGGVTPPKKLTGEQLKLQSSVQSAVTDLQFIKDNVSRRWIPGWAGNKQYNSAETNISDVMTRLRSGAAITPAEEKLYKSLLPKTTDSDETALSKITRLEEVLNGFLGTGQSGQQNDYSNITLPSDFSIVGGDTNTASIKDYSRVTTSTGSGVATGIERGSSLWKYGFDFVVDGGRGAEVKSPVSGTVIKAGTEGGFGNRVRIRLDDGRVIAAAHLDTINTKVGTRIQAGQVLGTQGNTGKTLGRTGIHVDWTLYGQDGRPKTSREAASFLGTKLA